MLHRKWSRRMSTLEVCPFREHIGKPSKRRRRRRRRASHARRGSQSTGERWYMNARALRGYLLDVPRQYGISRSHSTCTLAGGRRAITWIWRTAAQCFKMAPRRWVQSRTRWLRESVSVDSSRTYVNNDFNSTWHRRLLVHHWASETIQID
jgi:hypothetical protein